MERGRTATLKRKFHGAWTGRYRDLPNRVLHMTLVEQTRFGNLVESARTGRGEARVLFGVSRGWAMAPLNLFVPHTNVQGVIVVLV